MICKTCKWRKNSLRCGTCSHIEERIEKENYIPRFAFYPRKEQYEKAEIMGVDLADMRGEREC